MTRLVHRPIEVERWDRDWPLQFRDGDEVHVVQAVITEWLEMGNWWRGEGERRLVRVLTDHQEIYDLECQRPTKRWLIYRVWD
jgi:hypothetical protein